MHNLPPNHDASHVPSNSTRGLTLRRAWLELDAHRIEAELATPSPASGWVIFPRYTPATAYLARYFNESGLATLRAALALRNAPPEVASASLRRLHATLAWLRRQPEYAGQPVGLFAGSDPDGAVALRLAGTQNRTVASLALRGSAETLKGYAGPKINVPTLLLSDKLGEPTAKQIRRWIRRHLAGPSDLALVPGLDTLLADPAVLQRMAEATLPWFQAHKDTSLLVPARPNRSGQPWRRKLAAASLMAALGTALLPGTALANVTATFNSSTGKLTITGDSANDDIIITTDNEGFILINGDFLFINNLSLNANRVQALCIKGGGGNDRIDIRGVNASNFPELDDIDLQGEGGNDTIIGSDENDTLLGGDDDDMLEGLGGLDSLGGGLGLDTLLGGDDDDMLDGGFDFDSLDGGLGLDTLLGEEGDDFLNGGGDSDSLDGGLGLDTLLGDDGDDTLSGGRDTDSLVGGLGLDTLLGGDDADTLDGGLGLDTLLGEEGDDFLNGGGDNDSISGGLGLDTLLGEDGDDTLSGESGNDSISGGLGLDTLLGGDDDDMLDGGLDSDSLLGGLGLDTLLGDDGDDTLSGESGTDSISGGLGLDTLLGGDDADTLDGGLGLDTLLGEDGDDFLNGGDDNDSLDGGLGLDTLLGDDGDDTLSGGVGNDSLDGGLGLDTLLGGDDADTLDGGLGLDTLLGEDGNDSLLGGDDDDSISGGLGLDTLLGEDGDDFLIGDDDNDSLFGGLGLDTLLGEDGDDTLSGGQDADSIEGGEGDDEINEEEEDDSDPEKRIEVISAGPGNNLIRVKPKRNIQQVISGGAGNDTLCVDLEGVRFFEPEEGKITTDEHEPICFDGIEEVLIKNASPTGVEDGEEALAEIPGTHLLHSVYPNPVNDKAQFELGVAQRQHVEIELYDALGRRLGRLYDGVLDALRMHSFTINSAPLNNGLYVYVITGEHFRETGTMIVVK